MIPKSFGVLLKYFRVAAKSFRVTPNYFRVTPKSFRMAAKSFIALPGRSVAPPAQQGGEPGDHLGGDPLLVAGALEEKEGGRGLAVDRARLEGAHQLGREALQLLGAPLARQQQREVERDQRRVVVHPVPLELPLHLPVGGLRLVPPVQA